MMSSALPLLYRDLAPWSWDPDPEDSTFVSDFAYLLRDEEGSVRSVSERHVLGLFPRQTWLGSLSEAGFSPERVGFEFAGIEPDTYEDWGGGSVELAAARRIV